jgi:hypothetical protein
MAYVPDANDATRPVGGDPAGTADEEFRAIKAKLNAAALASGTRIPTRQCVLKGLVSTVGVSALLAISGTALGVDLKCGTTSGVFSWANGFNANGAVDSLQVLSADLNNNWGALPALATSFLSLDYVDGVTTPTPTKTLAPPQYGLAYDKTRQALLHFDGVAGATTITDDIGNTWAANGAGKLQTDQFKFGSAGLGGNAAGNALNGATPDGFQCSAIQTFEDGSWSMRAWVRPTALPGVGVNAGVFALDNAGGWGANVVIFNNAGTIRWAYSLSSNGVAADIAATQVGTSLPAINTWYFVELTYDNLNQKYVLYINGTAEASTASASRICLAAQMTVGYARGFATGLTGYIDEFEYLPYCDHPNAVAYAVPVAAPSVATQGYCQDWFDTVGYQMWQVTSASAVSGNNPGMTQKNRLYVGEADTSAVATTVTRSYAYNGKFTGQWVTPLTAVSTTIAYNCNFGTYLFDGVLEVQNLQTDVGFQPGQMFFPMTGPAAGEQAPFAVFKGHRNQIATVTGANAAFVNISGAAATLAGGSWKQRFVAQRRF